MKKETSALIIFYLVLIIIIVCLWGCSSTGRNDKAYYRVINNPNLSSRAFYELQKTRPCVNDTLTQLINGKEEIIYDTLGFYNTDTLTDVQTDIKYITKYKDVVKTIRKTDTIRSIVEDTRRWNLANDSLIYYRGKVDQLNADVKSERQRGNKWLGWFIGLVVVSIIIFIIKLYFKFVK